jgi:molybdopterin-containing oxidoreductase family molybdopterin binding subunit
MKRAGKRGEGKWERISWDEALDIIADRLQEISNTYGSKSFGWIYSQPATVGTGAFLEFASSYGGTFIMPTSTGDSATVCADAVSYGSPMFFGESYTMHFDNPALCLIWGGNFADTDHHRWLRVRDAKESGARVVVIDPTFTTTVSKADEWLPIRPGTDSALALGMMNVILSRGLHDASFLMDHTVGPFLVRGDNALFLREKDIVSGGSEKYMVWDAQTDSAKACDAPGISPALNGKYRVNRIDCKTVFQLLAETAEQYPPEKASEITEIPADTITRLAIEYATTKPAASFRGHGIQRTFHGDNSIRAVNTLAAVTGNMTLEGHESFELNFFDAALGIPDFMPLLPMYEAILTGEPSPIKALWIGRHSTLNQGPNYNKFVRELIPRLEFIVVADLFMTASARYADVLLPVCSHFECANLTFPAGVGAHKYLQVQKKVIEPLYESKSDYDMLALLAKKMGFQGCLNKSGEEFIEFSLASGHPSTEGITLEKLMETDYPPAPYKPPDFGTPSGRFEFYWERLLEFGQELPTYLEPFESTRNPLAQKYPLSYFTTHSKYRSNSMFTNIAWLRELDAKPFLEINPVDAEPRGIRDGDLVRVFNDRGEVKLKAKLHQGTRPGLINIFQGWWPGDFIRGTHQALTHDAINPAQQAIDEPNSALLDALAEVELVEEA